METMNSKEKLAYIVAFVGNVKTTRKSATSFMETLKTIADKAAMQSVDKIFNNAAEVTTMFQDLLTDCMKRVSGELETLIGTAHTVGDEFKSKCKAVEPDVASECKTTESYTKISVSRDGSENWSDSEAAKLGEAVDGLKQVRFKFITQLGEDSRKNVDSGFKTVMMKNGKSAEEVCNNCVKYFNEITAGCEALGVVLKNTDNELAALAGKSASVDAPKLESPVEA